VANTDTITSGGKKAGKEEQIKFSDRQTVYVTANGAKFGHKEGEEVSLHPKQAEDWIARGLASAEPAKKGGK
jgi:hypothetical protein